jgi:hypothetical protein
MSTLYCLLSSTEFRLDAYTLLSHRFLIEKKYRQSLVNTFHCLKLNPYYESCWDILLANYHHLKDNDKFLFYQEFKKSVFNSNPSLSSPSSSISMFENYKNFKKIKNIVPALNIFETEYYILSQNNHLIIPSEIKRKCNLFSIQYYNYNINTQSHFLKLSLKSTIKVLSTINEINGFEENFIGITDWLKHFGIHYKIVGIVSKNDDNSIYIISQFIQDMILPKRYIYWNYEKGPMIQLLEDSHKKLGFQMQFDGDDAKLNKKDEILFPLSFITGAMAIWENCFESLSYWRNIKYKGLEIPLFVVPPLTPLIDIQETCQIKHTLSFKDKDISSNDISNNEIDVESSEKPLDILFFGMYTPYRLEFAKMLRIKFYKNEWKSEIFVCSIENNVFGSPREALIDQANIVLNLNSYGPEDKTLMDFSLNVHRIRYLLGKGKVIISERSGSIDESIYEDVVLFVDGIDDMTNTIRRVLDNPEYRYNLEMKAINFMTNDYTFLINSDEDEKNNQLSHALIGDGGDSIDVFNKSTIQNLYNAIKFISQNEKLNKKIINDIDDDDDDNIDSLYNPIDMSDAELAMSWASWQSFERHVDGGAFVYKSRSRYYDNILTANDKEHIFNSNGIDKQLVIGYLQRRYQYKGRYLEIGCTTTDNTILQMTHPKFSEKMCVDPYTNEASYKMTSDDFFKNYKNLNFDLVFVGMYYYFKFYYIILIFNYLIISIRWFT